MANKRKHEIPYQIWNQMRLAMQVDEYLQLYEALGGSGSTTISSAVRQPMMTASRALFQTILVHLDMIEARQGVSIMKINDQAFMDRLIPEKTYLEIKSTLIKHHSTLINIRMQRNNIMAHRAENMTFAEVKKKYPVTDVELRNLTDDYYDMASKLYHDVPFQNPWQRQDQTAPNQDLVTWLNSHP